MKRITPEHAERVPLHFKSHLNPLDDKIREDVSSCVRTGDYLWLAFDESTRVERLHWTGKSWAEHESISLFDFFDLKGDHDEEIDIEGMAYDSHYLWITGSQSTKRGKPKAKDSLSEQMKDLAKVKAETNRYTFGRIPCVPDEKGVYRLHRECQHPENPKQTLTAMRMKSGNTYSFLTKKLRKDEHLKAYMKLPCKDNGFDIEGLAVSGDRVFLGLRGPILNGWAVILELHFKEKKGHLKPRKIGPNNERYRKHFLALAGMGIRELSAKVTNGDMLLLAGPTMDLDGTISLWRLPDGIPDEPVSFIREPERLYDVSLGPENGYGTDKAEGIAVLEDGRILVVYDAPSEIHRLGSHGLYGDVFPAPRQD